MRRGVSPTVIAIILVAVTLVLVITLGSWVMGSWIGLEITEVPCLT